MSTEVTTVKVGSSQYRTIHNWLIRHFGKASCCEGSNCSGKSNKYDWALKKGFSYDKNREHFLQLCVSCHKKYDMTERAMEIGRDNLNKGRYSKNKPVVKLDEVGNELEKYESVSAAAREMGCGHTAIIFAIQGRLERVKGFKWKYDNQQKQTNE